MAILNLTRPSLFRDPLRRRTVTDCDRVCSCVSLVSLVVQWLLQRGEAWVKPTSYVVEHFREMLLVHPSNLEGIMWSV